MPRSLIFRRDRCLACRSCELACAVIHSQSGRLETAVFEELPPKRRVAIVQGRMGIEALRCKQCGEPLCVFSCKSGALQRAPLDGHVVFDDTRCVACLMCLMVCPFGIRPDPARGRIARCDVCRDLETPACVAACPTRALGTCDEPAAGVRSTFNGRLVVVGSSAAGIAACEAAREWAPDCSIVMVTADRVPQYSRPLLPYVLSGRAERAALGWRAEDYLETRLGVTVLTGRRATHLDTDIKSLTLDDGRELAFDRLVIATGARAATLPIPGADLPGVFSLRTLDDLDALDRLARPGRRAVVLGGGNVGLQTCEAVLARGVSVTVVARSSHLLSQMVDQEAGRRVGELFGRHGLVLRTGRDAAEISGECQVEAVRLDDGEMIAADMVIVAKGIQPNVEWVRASRVQTGRGVLVDLSGRTSVSEVFAAGDCSEVTDPLTGQPATSGIWPVAYEMGRSAGSTAVGVERASCGALRMNASRFFGESIISIGEVRAERLPGAVGHVLADSERVYRKVVLRDRRLVGALLYGDVSRAGLYYRLYRERVDLTGVTLEDLERTEPNTVLKTEADGRVT
jgi:NAD(P)H-nitrite reductase large subunit